MSTTTTKHTKNTKRRPQGGFVVASLRGPGVLRDLRAGGRPRVYTALPLAVTLAAVLVMPALSQERRPTFRSGRDIVSVDVVVRDRAGNLVRGLTAADFEVREDGRPQEVVGFSFQEIADEAVQPLATTDLLAEAQGRMLSGTAPSAEPKPLAGTGIAGRRLMLLLFDLSSMQPEEVQRAIDSANRFVSEEMSAADLVGVATIGSQLDVLTDFTGDRAAVAASLARLAYTDGTAIPPPDAATAASDEAAAAATDATAAEATELDMFNNDVRLRALRAIAETLAPLEQRKAILYFSAGMQRSGQDNQVELRSAINAAVRAHVAIYPVDTRGLQALVPGGDATQASGRGVAMFSGRGVARQFAQLAASQDTLTSLAADTGGRAFTDGNDFGEAFARARRDLSAYYLLGYTSTNTVKDGRFRRIQVRVKRDGARVDARAGYFAERDFAHTSRADREAQLQEQLFSPVSSTDLPVMVTGGFFRLAADRYYVPISVAVPGYAVPVKAGKEEVALDILGIVLDEQGRPLGRMRETLRLPPGTGATLAGKQVLYQSGVTLPPGRFSVKVVVRENTNGTIGSFETPMAVPELKQAPVKVSSIVLSTQLQPLAGAQSRGRDRGGNPLVRDGVQIVPSVTRVVARDQKLLFYYEVYEPGEIEGGPQLRTSLAFYRGKVKVYETPAVDRTTLDAPDRRAAIFQFEVPAESLAPGLYTCQINVIDQATGRFAFPRLALYVR
ncbi:MAG TPA: VWA domain-containing protein [Vicinamibacterales bacterium]|nr:VWA domain-containing protein [Vicinamibacterales bacterium]